MSGELKIIIERVLMLFVLIIVGFIAKRTRYISQETSDNIPKMLTKLILPALVFSTIMNPDLSMDKITGNIVFYLAGIIVPLSSLVIVFFISRLIRSTEKDHAVFFMLSSFSNVIFMGMPLCQALFGDVGVLGASMLAIGQDTVLWSVGMIMLGKYGFGEKNKGHLLNPLLITFVTAVILKLLNIPLPNFIYQPIHSLGAVTAYLAMVYVGTIVASVKIGAIFKNFRLYVFLILKLICIPMLLVLIMFVFLKGNLTDLQKNVILIEFSTSSVISLTPFFKEHNLNFSYACAIVVTGVILSMVTVPFMLWISQHF